MTARVLTAALRSRYPILSESINEQGVGSTLLDVDSAITVAGSDPQEVAIAFSVSVAMNL